MTTLSEQYEIKMCVDCAMLIANGEPNPEWSELEHHNHVTAMQDNWPGGEFHLVVGNDEEWFSWSRCDSCGSTLGGSRLNGYAFKINKEEK
jgi:hypothetical protein